MVELSLSLWIYAIGVTVVAGFIKGAIGFAMPLVMVSGLTAVLEPSLAVGIILLPIVMANLLQTFRTGISPAIEAIRRFWRYLLVACLAIVAFAQLLPSMDPQVFYLVLGIPVVGLSLMQLLGIRMTIPKRHRGWAEWLIGLLSGILGGLAGNWGPTTVLYLMAIDTPKVQQIVAQGVIYGTASIALLFAHIHSGILNAQTLPPSAALLVPGFFGMWLGFKLQDRLDQALFRKLTLLVLIVAGLNLIRRGIMG